MTLQNGLVHGQTGYLWTDTAALDPTSGIVRGHISKAFYGNWWPWAAVFSGMMVLEDPGRMARAVAAADPMNPEDLLQACVQALRDEELNPGAGGRLLVCYSWPGAAPRLWLISSDDTEVSKAFVPEEFVEFMSVGAEAAPPPGVDFGAITPENMLEVIDWQVPLPTKTVCGLEQPTIGGNIIQVEVSLGGVEQRIVREMVGTAAA